MKELQAKVDLGVSLEFDKSDVHIAAVLLKTFLRELSAPLLTYQLYDSILLFKGGTQISIEFLMRNSPVRSTKIQPVKLLPGPCDQEAP